MSPDSTGFQSVQSLNKANITKTSTSEKIPHSMFIFSSLKKAAFAAASFHIAFNMSPLPSPNFSASLKIMSNVISQLRFDQGKKLLQPFPWHAHH